MASTAESVTARKRWVRRRRSRLGRGWFKWAGAAVILCALLIGAILLMRRAANAADPAAARRELAESVRLYQAGNYSGARASAA